MSPFTVSASARTSNHCYRELMKASPANMSVIVTHLAASARAESKEGAVSVACWARPLSVGPLTDQYLSDHYKYMYFKKSMVVNPNSTSAQV